MEDLTKQQIILVTLLVSFVTSIATGIVTVALMQQVPPAVTQTINRVVEHTIERVVQSPSQSTSVVTKETVVEKEDDQVIAAIEKNAPSLVRVLRDVGNGQTEFLALGLVLTKDGIIALDKNMVSSEGHYVANFSDDKIYALTATSSPEGSIVLYKVSLPDKVSASFTPSTLGNSDQLKLGQALVFLGGKTSNAVETGIISNLKIEAPKSEQATTTEVASVKKVIEIITSIHPPENVSGGLFMNLSTEIVGFRILRDDRFVVLPSNVIAAILQSYVSPKAPGAAAQTP